MLRKVLFVFGLFWLYCTASGILVPNQRSNQCPLQWKHEVLTTGPPGFYSSESFNSTIFMFFALSRVEKISKISPNLLEFTDYHIYIYIYIYMVVSPVSVAKNRN